MNQKKKTKKSEQDMPRHEDVYRTLAENLPDIVYRLHLQGARHMQFFNDRITEFTGFSPDEFTVGRVCSMESRMLKEDGKRVIETVENAIRNRGPFEVEYRFLHRNGSIITFLERGTVICDVAGVPLHIDGVIRDISDRKAMEDELRASERRYKAVVDSQEEFVVRYLPGGIITFINDTLCKYVQMGREDLLGKSYYPFMHPSDRDTFVRKIEALDRDAPRMIAEARAVLPDGRVVWHRWAHHAIFDKDGSLVEYQCTGRDVTDLKLAEDNLRRSEKRYRELVEAANSVILTWDTTGNLLFLNNFALTFFGYGKEELIGRNVIGTIVPETESSGRDLAHLMREIQRDPDRFRDNENENITKDGRRVWVRWANKAIEDENGNLTGILSIGHDITERKRVEHALRQSEERFATAFRNNPAWLAIVHMETMKVMEVNNAWIKLFGYSREEAIGRTTVELGIYDEDAYRRIIEDTKSGKSARNIEVTIRNRSDENRVLLVSREVIQIADEPYLLAMGSDITERKQAEEALKESERSMKTLMGNLPGMVYRCRNDRHGTMEYVSEGATTLTGYQVADLIGNAKIAYNDLIHPDDQKPVWDAVQIAIGRREKFTLNYRIQRADEQERWVWEQGQGVYSEEGGLLALEGFITDITERRLLDEERQKIQKLESVGTLAGGIAHDFNNLLQGIFGYISIAKMTYDQKERSLSMLEQAEEALHLTVNLTTQLLTFSKGGKPVKKLIRVGPAVEKAVKFSLSGSHTDYLLDIAADLWPIEADEGQLTQVIQNIVLNAQEAVAGRGTVRVSAGNADISRETSLGLPSGGQFVRIAIQDSGIGIPDQNLAKIFDPYFTTKQKGSGLGLATSYSIIKNHGGMIEVKSEVNKGSTFSIYLPAAQGAETASETTTSTTISARKGKILLMDDEELVRNVAKQMITALGHDVEGAADGEKAIELFRQARESESPFDLVILDLTVKGGMGGEEAIRMIREMDPDVAAIVSSGYADSPVVANYRTYGFSAFLNKPYKIDSLSECLNALLNQS